MSLTGTNNEQKIWNFLMSHLNNPFAVAGLMGNIYAESGLSPINLQQTYEKSLGFSDRTYTESVDNGTYTNFVRDSAGYGLCQWTYWSRKQNLLDYVKSKGKSIGDLETQLEFLVKELTSYGLVDTLKGTTSVREASNVVLLEFEKPASKDTQETQDRRAGFSQKYYDKYVAGKTSVTPTSQKGATKMGYTNSPLVSHTRISPNKTSPRNHIIDRISVHCVAGQCTVETLGNIFAPTSRQASSNYGIGPNGRIGMYVEEKDRSWCTSSGANDHRAVTIEVASDTKHPYAVKTPAYEALIKLCADICKRNGKKRLIWFADKNKALSYKPASDEMVMTVHRWFSNTACPGDYLYSHHADIAAKVNAMLGSASVAPETAQNSGNTAHPTQNTSKKVTANKAAQEKDPALAGTYVVTASNGLHLRNNAGTPFKSLCVIPNGTKVKCYGYYSKDSKGAKWLYIQFTLKGVTYTGFSHSAYLKKV